MPVIIYLLPSGQNLCLAFNMLHFILEAGYTYVACTIHATTWITSMVSKEAWSQCVETMKQQCAKTITGKMFSSTRAIEWH
jgi:hypothetical protein